MATTSARFCFFAAAPAPPAVAPALPLRFGAGIGAGAFATVAVARPRNTRSSSSSSSSSSLSKSLSKSYLAALADSRRGRATGRPPFTASLVVILLSRVTLVRTIVFGSRGVDVVGVQGGAREEPRGRFAGASAGGGDARLGLGGGVRRDREGKFDVGGGRDVGFIVRGGRGGGGDDVLELCWEGERFLARVGVRGAHPRVSAEDDHGVEPVLELQAVLGLDVEGEISRGAASNDGARELETPESGVLYVHDRVLGVELGEGADATLAEVRQLAREHRHVPGLLDGGTLVDVLAVAALECLGGNELLE